MARLISNTKDMLEADWLELRRSGLGGSDASAVAGVNKYSSPVMVYMDKLGLYVPDKPDHVKEAAAWGHIHEPVIRQQFVMRVNAERAAQGKEPLKVVHRKAIFAHDEHDFMRTNLDGIVYDPELGKGVFEAKTAHYMLRDEWEGEDVPNAYYIQCQHNMAVMDMQFAWLAVLIGGNQFKYYFIPRDQEFIDYLIMIEQKFWNDHILQRIPPAMSGHDAEKDMLREQYPQSEMREGYITNLPNSAIALAEQVDMLKQLISELEQEKTAAENEIKAMLGDTEMAFAGSHRVSWKTDVRGVKTMRIKLDAQEDREKFYEAKLKVVRKQIAEVMKERAAIEKEADKLRKQAEKDRKAIQKAEEAALKAEEKARKKAEKELEKAAKEAEKEAKKAEKAGESKPIPEYEIVLKRHLEDYRESEHKLSCLEAAGVDNWEGYDYAMEMMENDMEGMENE